MLEQNKPSDYNRLFEQYSKKTDAELMDIINSNNDYTEMAKKVASDILQSDRMEPEPNITQQKLDMEKIISKLYIDIHSIKNMLLFFVVLTILGLIFGFYAVFITIPKLF